MGHWSYRILKDENDLLGVKEIYYDDDGIWAFTENAVSLGGFEIRTDIVADLELMLESIKKQVDILDEKTIMEKIPMHPRNIEAQETLEQIKSGEIKTSSIEEMIEKLEKETKEKDDSC